MEVLEGLAAMQPTEEIATSLYVSVNTVKTHVRSILRKLSASRRNEAVRRARGLGLVNGPGGRRGQAAAVAGTAAVISATDSPLTGSKK
jgi:DNA-binding CsgD family transcriptional regulator